MERQEKYYNITQIKSEFTGSKINETNEDSESTISQISASFPDYSNVKLLVDEVDLEEIDDDQKQREMFQDTSNAVKEMIKIQR